MCIRDRPTTLQNFTTPLSQIVKTVRGINTDIFLHFVDYEKILEFESVCVSNITSLIKFIQAKARSGK